MIRFGIGLVSVAFTFALALSAPAQDAVPGASEVKMTAKKYVFTPDTITVKKGDHVRLLITALDHAHGFKIDAFHIDKKLPKGEEVTVEFTADRAGTFPFECSVFCGMGHRKMKGELIVE